MVGQSTVAMSRPSTIGSRIDHSVPSTQNSTTTAAAISRNCAEAIASVRAARCILGPGPPWAPVHVVIGARSTGAAGRPGRPRPRARCFRGADRRVERPGKRSLMRSITAQLAAADRAGNDHRGEVVLVKS